MPSSQLIDLSKLTPPELLENLEYEQILEQLKSKLSELVPDVSKTLELESEPLTQVLNTSAYHSMLLKGRINDTVKGNLLATATNSDLDHIATRYGVSRLPEESDERFRSRIQQAFHSLNTAGTEESYRYHALTADSRVKDIHVASPSPCHVVLSILSNETENGAPSTELINTLAAAFGLTPGDQDSVSEVLLAQRVRPIGDRVEIVPAVIKPFNIKAKVKLELGPGHEQVRLNVITKLRQFLQQQSSLGKSVKQSALFAVLHQVGVEEVNLISPTSNIEVLKNEVAWCVNGTTEIDFEVSL